MNPYEKLIKTIREEGANGVELPSMGFAEMTGENSLSFNGLNFEEDDILIPDHMMEREVEIDLTTETEKYPEPEEEPGHKHKIILDKKKVTISSELSEGDTVFGVIVNYDEDDKFLILCKVPGGE